MRILLPTAVLILIASPVLAQFPPSGVYQCSLGDGGNMGELTVVAGGDYTMKNVDGSTDSGQMASSGNRIDIISGPLKDMQVSGEVSTAGGHTTFRFTQTEDIVITCK